MGAGGGTNCSSEASSGSGGYAAPSREGGPYRRPRGGRPGRGGRGRPEGRAPAAGQAAGWLAGWLARPRGAPGTRDGGGGRQLRAARVPDAGYMLCPGSREEDGRERWGRGGGRERAGRLGQPLQQSAPRRGQRRPDSDHFNCGSAGGARARPLARDTARRRRSAPPAPGGGGAGRGGARGLAQGGSAGEKRDLGAARPLPRRDCPDASGDGGASRPLFGGGWRRFRTSCVTSVFHRRADVWRCKFKSCHWPRLGLALPLHFPPHHQP